MGVYDQWHRAARPGDQPCDCGTKRAPLYPGSRHQVGDRWQVRYRDLEGKQKKKNFARRVGRNPGEHADAFDAQVSRDVDTGNYTDPKLAETTLREYAEQWRKGRGHDPERAAYVERQLRNHVYEDPAHPGRTPKGGVPVGQHALGLLARRPSLSQGWIQAMPLADSSKRQVVEIASAVYRAAIDDGIIGRDPTRAASVTRPSPGRTKARPWPRERIAAMRDALPPRFAVMPELGAGSGLRQGEMFGLAADDIQFLARKPVISVTRQVKIVGGRPHFGPLKNRKPHSVPLSPVLRDLLARHMELYPPAAVTLPWHDPRDKAMHGTLVTVRLVLTGPRGGALHRRDFDEQVWRRALLKAGIIASERGPARQDGCHVLRHTYASVQLRAGVDVVRVAAWLGDTPAMVVGTYGHLLPGDDDSEGRAAVDAFLSSCAPDVPRAGESGTLRLAGRMTRHSHLDCRRPTHRRRQRARVFGLASPASKISVSMHFTEFRRVSPSCAPAVPRGQRVVPHPVAVLGEPLIDQHGQRLARGAPGDAVPLPEVHDGRQPRAGRVGAGGDGGGEDRGYLPVGRHGAGGVEVGELQHGDKGGHPMACPGVPVHGVACHRRPGGSQLGSAGGQVM